jgi:hypothetical protein
MELIVFFYFFFSRGAFELIVLPKVSTFRVADNAWPAMDASKASLAWPAVKKNLGSSEFDLIMKTSL